MYIVYCHQFNPLNLNHIPKLNELASDVDSVVVAFTDASAYRPVVPFNVIVDGHDCLCKNTKLLFSIFGSARKSMFNLWFNIHDYCCYFFYFGCF